jgi:hypothetical protein
MSRWMERMGLVAAGFALGVLSLGLPMTWLLGPSTFDGLPALLMERVRGETPQARVDAYVQAVLAGDEEAALAAWTPPDPERDEELSEALRQRRRDVTRQLIAAELGEAYTIADVEWWTTCCEPHVTCDARNAGGARIRVQFLDRDGLPIVTVFDVLHRDGAYWGAAAGHPPRRWALYDVYPRGEEPLAWRYTNTSETAWLSWPADGDIPMIEW